MKKAVLTLSVLLAALFAGGAYAQSKGEADPSQAQAAPSKPATKAEKQAARKHRNATGKDVAKSTKTGDDQPNSKGVAHGNSKAEKKEASAERKAEGAQATKDPKEKSGPN